MKPLQKAHHVPKTEDQLMSMAKTSGISLDKIKEDMIKMQSRPIYKNQIYTVIADFASAVTTGWIHLSVRRNDRRPCTDWRHKQMIKNQLVGPEHEAIELFPAESRMVDESNQYHLWVLADPSQKLPVGFNFESVKDSDPDDISGARQRKIK